MNVLWTIYDAGTGRIVSSGSSSEETARLQKGGDLLLGVKGDRYTQHVVEGEVVDRPTIPGLSEIPPDTRVRIDGVDHGVCDDGLVEIETDIPGTYHVHLDPPFPYQPLDAEVEV